MKKYDKTINTLSPKRVIPSILYLAPSLEAHTLSESVNVCSASLTAGVNTYGNVPTKITQTDISKNTEILSIQRIPKLITVINSLNTP